MGFNKYFYLALYWIVVMGFAPSASLLGARSLSCYEMFHHLQVQRAGGIKGRENTFAGTFTRMVRAFEKEGLFYGDIIHWFDRADKNSTVKLIQSRLNREANGHAPKKLERWIEQYPEKYKADGIELPENWAKMNLKAKAEFIFNRANPLEAIKLEGNEELFLEQILNFDVLRPAEGTPEWLTVGDDQGSYEVRSSSGEINRKKYQEQLRQVEEHLDGKVGHQHLIHEWPKEKEARVRIAPQYIELLDAGTWYLFWRQTKRNPDEVESILTHPYLGVYNRASLEKLERAMIEGKYEDFKNKYRMIGARNVKGREGMPDQTEGQPLADFERRSGNKGIKRDFLEDVIEARFASGDFTGLRSIHDYAFDASAPMRELTQKYLSEKEIEMMERFEKEFKWLKYSDSSRSFNHFRNKILAPLLPWESRIPLDHKLDVLERARKRFAEGLAKIGQEYLKEKDKITEPHKLGELTAETMEKIQRLSYLFSDRVRLDEDFEHYLTPRPTQLPEILVDSTGPIDVNKINLGVEYSFRFPDSPRHKTTAQDEIKETAKALSSALGGSEIKEESGEGHGHNLSVKYSFTDSEGRKWRVEWDGVTRTYVDGKAVNPRRGHIEIPSPKWSPQTPEEIAQLYQTMRDLGKLPRRGAGGAHVNVDLAPLKALPEKEGARKMANLLNYFESNREMIQFLWQHPYRTRAAVPVEMSPALIEKLNHFDGTWEELGRVLYEEKYFNPFETRKPSYTQLNATALMASIIPAEYQRTIDIKNPEVPWAPAFGGKGTDRVEFRLFDAPTDEYLASLQVKYIRAVLNQALNGPKVITHQARYENADFESWKQDSAKFLRAARQHFKELGLDPEEFKPLLGQAQFAQSAIPVPKTPLREFPGFLPPQSQPK
ncbi:MAG: amidoligase family protein [Deltaproteobacteria bacterium]